MPSTSPPVEPAVRRKRAIALPADARRSMIIDAAFPLLLDHGEGVTTQQIANAAGIAEGTVFRVFPSKDDLIEAIIDKALDPEPIERAIAAIPSDGGLESSLIEVVRLMQRRVTDIWQLMSVAGPRFHHHGRRPSFASAAVTDLLGVFGDRLDVEPSQAALMLRAATISMTHPLMTPEPFRPEAIVRYFLHGVQKPC